MGMVPRCTPPPGLTRNPDIQVTPQQWLHGEKRLWGTHSPNGLQFLGGDWTLLGHAGFSSALGPHLGWARTSPREALYQACPARGQRGHMWAPAPADTHHATEPREGTGAGQGRRWRTCQDGVTLKL